MIQLPTSDRARARMKALASVCGVLGAIYVLLFIAFMWHAVSAGLSTEEFVIATGDSHEYVALAQVLLSEHRYALSSNALPEQFRAPGYPFFLAALFAAWANPLVVPIVQMILTIGCALLVALIGEKLFSLRTGIIAAFLYGLEPTVIAHAYVALSETLFMVLLLGGVLVSIVAQAPRHIFLGGFLIGLCALVRPVGVFVIVPIILYKLWQNRSQGKALLVIAVVMCLGLGLAIAPWMSRNQIVGGQYTISSIGSFNPLFYNAVLFESVRRQVPENTIREEIYASLGTSDSVLLRDLRYAASEKALTRLYIGAHPIQYGVFHMVKTIPFFLGSGLAADFALLRIGISVTDINVSSLVLKGDVAGSLRALFASPISVLEMLFWALVLCLSIVSVWIAYMTSTYRASIIFCSLIVLGFAISTGPISMPRYRIPAEPFLFFMATVAAAEILARVSQRFFPKTKNL